MMWELRNSWALSVFTRIRTNMDMAQTKSCVKCYYQTRRTFAFDFFAEIDILGVCNAHRSYILFAKKSLARGSNCPALAVCRLQLNSMFFTIFPFKRSEYVFVVFLSRCLFYLVVSVVINDFRSETDKLWIFRYAYPMDVSGSGSFLFQFQFVSFPKFRKTYFLYVSYDLWHSFWRGQCLYSHRFLLSFSLSFTHWLLFIWMTHNVPRSRKYKILA